MIDYSKLENWYSEHRITYALRIAKGAAAFHKGHDYIPEDITKFEPHLWVVAAICESIGDGYSYRLTKE